MAKRWFKKEIALKESDSVIQCGHRGTGGEQGGIYSSYSIAPTIPASCYKDPLKVVVNERE